MVNGVAWHPAQLVHELLVGTQRNDGIAVLVSGHRSTAQPGDTGIAASCRHPSVAPPLGSMPLLYISTLLERKALAN
jgi:hypothetical protein